MEFENSQGKIFYGMHFYPGVAQYDNADGSFRVFINEDTIRGMSQSFAGRPVFVDHVEEVDEDVNQLRTEADGWVIKSFYNAADGKTWAEFIVVSDRGLAAIRQGYRLSNAYIPQLRDARATWNGVDYQKVVTGGEFEHLAIVKHPRYEESVILSPEEFKQYNEDLSVELKRLANSKDKKGEPTVKFFKRQKLENSIDIESTMVELPKSKKEMTLAKVINDHDAFLNMNGYANGDHMVKVGDKDEMSVNDLVKKHMELCNKMSEYENEATEDGGEPERADGDDPELANEDEGDEAEEMDSMENEDLDISEDGVERHTGGDKSIGSEFEKTDKKIAPSGAARKSLANKAAAKRKASALRNAHLAARDQMSAPRIELAEDMIRRGQERYGRK